MDASGKTKLRIEMDFRKLNYITEDDEFPLPNIDDIEDIEDIRIHQLL